MRRLLPTSIVLSLAAFIPASPAASIALDDYLAQGRLAEAETELTRALTTDSANDEARLSLGLVQLIRSVERQAQFLYRYGLKTRGTGFLQLAAPLTEDNPSPQRIAYADFRRLFERCRDDLGVVDQTLSRLGETETKVCIHVGRIRLDLTGDGRPSADWHLRSLFNRSRALNPITPEQSESFTLCVDNADAEWIRGYCHVLMAGCECALAYDMRELFERTAHLAFKQVDSPYDFLEGGRQNFGFLNNDILDAIAYIHLLNFECVEPARMPKALAHLKETIQRSRAMCRRLSAETDDDHEWIPNPTQHGAIPGLSLTPERLAAWQEFLGEADDVLDGKKLVPFWRGSDDRGVDIRKVFMEPRRLDLVLWIQGTAAAPYLTKGPVITPESWTRIQRAFQGEFYTFALWLN